MFLPNVFHYSDWSTECVNRGYVNVRFSAHDGGNVSVTSVMKDGVVDPKDIMVHLPACSFANDPDNGMIIIT